VQRNVHFSIVTTNIEPSMSIEMNSVCAWFTSEVQFVSSQYCICDIRIFTILCISPTNPYPWAAESQLVYWTVNNIAWSSIKLALDRSVCMSVCLSDCYSHVSWEPIRVVNSKIVLVVFRRINIDRDVNYVFEQWH
jgi:hypothetical protein